MAINVVELNAALEQLEVSKGISRETVLEALKEAMTKGFKKDIGDEEANVEVNIDLEKGLIEMYQIKTVVEDEEDPLLEIDIKEANKNGKKYKVGDEYRIQVKPEELRKAIVLSIKSVLKQKFAEAEKQNLFEQFKDKIGTMITGKVEQFDERGASINIGRTSVFMPRKEMIKDEKFLLGENIKLFVSDVASSSKGAHIVVSRANEGFLKALMSEEIHDIYDGTIEIVAIAREAGERSKVAVYCKDPNIDPAGTCIGPNGNRIQKVVSQLGNGSAKEKIDIITYSTNNALFIMEALKPARVVGVQVNEEEKSALVVVKDDSFSVAIGKKGVNARLAVKLTGFKIDIKTETEANELGLEYVSFEEISAEALQEKAERIAQAQREELVYPAGFVVPGLPEGYVAPQERKYEEESNDFDVALEQAAEKEELEVAPTTEEVKVEEVKEEPVSETNEEVVEEVKAEVVKEEPKEEQQNVKVTSTLEDLEKSLENAKTGKKQSTGRRKKKTQEEEKEETIDLHTEGPRMSIYTDEELKELEEEDQLEEEIEDDDIDYDEYDQYYDED